jgi:hypothetical protein
MQVIPSYEHEKRVLEEEIARLEAKYEKEVEERRQAIAKTYGRDSESLADPDKMFDGWEEADHELSAWREELSYYKDQEVDRLDAEIIMLDLSRLGIIKPDTKQVREIDIARGFIKLGRSKIEAIYEAITKNEFIRAALKKRGIEYLDFKSKDGMERQMFAYAVENEKFAYEIKEMEYKIKDNAKTIKSLKDDMAKYDKVRDLNTYIRQRNQNLERLAADAFEKDIPF